MIGVQFKILKKWFKAKTCGFPFNFHDWTGDIRYITEDPSALSGASHGKLLAYMQTDQCSQMYCKRCGAIYADDQINGITHVNPDARRDRILRWQGLLDD